MNLSHLIRRLQDMQEDLDGADPEVRIAYWQFNPLAVPVAGVALSTDLYDKDVEDEEELETEEEVVWIASGTRGDFNPYDVPRSVFDHAY